VDYLIFDEVDTTTNTQKLCFANISRCHSNVGFKVEGNKCKLECSANRFLFTVNTTKRYCLTDVECVGEGFLANLETKLCT
jgi:hypothetical protein